MSLWRMSSVQQEPARVAQPGPDEINRAFGFHVHSLFKRRVWAMNEGESFDALMLNWLTNQPGHFGFESNGHG